MKLYYLSENRIDYTPGTLLLNIQTRRSKFGTPIYIRTKGGHVREVNTHSMSGGSGYIPLINGSHVHESNIDAVLDKNHKEIMLIGSPRTGGKQQVTSTPTPPPPPQKKSPKTPPPPPPPPRKKLVTPPPPPPRHPKQSGASV